MYSLDEIFKGSTHKSSVFSSEAVNFLEAQIYTKNLRGSEVPHVKCQIRNKEVRLNPEEAVRQLYVYTLIHDYGYPPEKIRLEHQITFGREKKRADIVILNETEYIIIEVKKPKLLDGKEQLKSYCNATGALIGVWTNGQEISYYHRKDPNIFESIDDIPKSTETLDYILSRRWTIEDLSQKDKLIHERRTLKGLIEEMENDVLANAGVDAFEEVFKLIFTKLYDEMQSGRDKSRFLEFRNYGSTDKKNDEKAEERLKHNLDNLFNRAKAYWPGVFGENETFSLTPSHLAVCVSALQDVKLFNSNLEVVDDAFEYLMNKSQKGEKGQFFTPRYVIDMCVQMLNPSEDESMIDTAAGSCGFPVHTMFYVWKKILASRGLHQSHLFTAEKKPPECEDYVKNKVFAIDFDEKAVRVARTLNLIAGDGRTNVLHLNTLDYDRWEETVKPKSWQKAYSEGWLRFTDFCEDEESYKNFTFDIVMANPPFAGDIKEDKILRKYELAKNSKGDYVSKIGRDILFIERNLQFLKPGGRMAIILPQGRFNNSSDKYIRDFISEQCRILAVIGLHVNVFKPHTGTKTSVLLVQKWDDVLCPRKEDYPIFTAAMQKPGKDNSGDKIYVKGPDGRNLTDKNGHLIVEHDLFNHEGLTQDGIAEAFIEFAKREGLSFFGDARPCEVNLPDGLEYSEVMLSEITSAGRLDAEYFSKQNIFLHAKLEAIGSRTIADYGGYLDCSAFYPSVADYYSNDRTNNIPFIRVNEINGGMINITDATVFLPEKILKANSKTMALAYPGDIVIAKGGTIAKVGLVTEDFPVYATCRDVIILRTDRLHDINKFFLWGFLYSSYGRGILMRSASQTIQPHLTLPAILAIKIPDIITIQPEIEKLYKLSVNMKREADELYSDAQAQLTHALHFDTFEISQANTAIISFSKMFDAGRYDAEYFMPKYEDYLRLLATFETTTIPDEFYVYKNSGVNYSETSQDVGVIKTKQLTNRGINTEGVESWFDNDACANSTFLRLGDVVFASMGVGSLGKVSLFDYDGPQRFVTDSTLKIYRAKEGARVKPEVLCLFLQSEIGQEIIYRYVVGSTGIINIYDRDIATIPIPIFDEKTQNDIAENVQKSFILRRKSEKLIDIAVRAVELAIEHDENFAMNYILSEEEKIS